MSPHTPSDGEPLPDPFRYQVMHSPWDPVIDAPSLHREVKNHIRTLVNECGQDKAIRCLTVVGPPGYGKTHLVAWMRQLLDERDDAVFVYVPPYAPAAWRASRRSST
jgi:hypothetical protein